MKTIKVYLKNCPTPLKTQIYCMKHEGSEDLLTLKEKIFKRCPELRSAGEAKIYWFDLENDKIRINCDDDLRFFIEESKIQKLIFEYGNTESTTRKRSSSSLSGELSDGSKRIRRRMEKIDLSNDSELSSNSDDEQNEILEQQSVVTSTVEGAQAQKSPSIDNEPKVKIISIDIIKKTEPAINNEDKIELPQKIEAIKPESNNSNLTGKEIDDNNGKVSTSTESKSKTSDSNRIVISDSSDDEGESNDNSRNRRFSDGYYSSAYSFADINRERFESRVSFDDDFRRYRYRRRRDEFDENARQTYRNCPDNMRSVFQQANIARAQAQAASDHTMRNLRNSTNFLPDLLSTFQTHFRPLFQRQPPFDGNNF